MTSVQFKNKDTLKVMTIMEFFMFRMKKDFYRVVFLFIKLIDLIMTVKSS